MHEHKITVPVGGENSGTFEEWQTTVDRLGMDPDAAAAMLDLASISHDETAPWEGTVTWSLDGETATPIAVELRSRNGQPVTPEAWRTVKVAAVIGETRNRLNWIYGRISDVLAGKGNPEAATTAKAYADPLAGTPRRGRRSIYDAAHFARVAGLYNAAVRSGDTRPVRTVAHQLAATMEDPQLTKDNRVKAWVREARKRGLIHGERNKENG
ncbi:hypothetical protein [Arthrobacter sp. Leaf69]|uniref:hypothetical protein n=1 Tax=Arthrobacter sp. Leaf69 TaxID=1736232 RepID=UPI0006F8C2E2|nr:hypothetical protein [Arthrobacter sp. Leaf69]KQN94883.1 hypothetical protein ASE96_01420 [Arthrobacter sp. Leaf69]